MTHRLRRFLLTVQVRIHGLRLGRELAARVVDLGMDWRLDEACHMQTWGFPSAANPGIRFRFINQQIRQVIHSFPNLDSTKYNATRRAYAPGWMTLTLTSSGRNSLRSASDKLSIACFEAL